MSLSQRATCHIFSSHKESTSLFEVAEGVGQKRWQKRWLQGGKTKKGGWSRDHWEDKSEIQRKEEKRRGDRIVREGRNFFSFSENFEGKR